MKSKPSVLLAAGLLLFSGMLNAEAPPARTVAVNIEPQPLDLALNALAEQTGLQLLFRASHVRKDMKVARLAGRYTPQEALNRLLANTGLKYEYLDAQTVTIVSAGDRNAPPSTHNLSGQPLRLSLARVETAETQAVPRNESSSQEIVVEGERDKLVPYRDANVDLPRTVDDVKPYYIFDSETLDTSGAQTVEEFLAMRLPMSTAGYAYTDLRGSSVVAAARGSSQLTMRGMSTDETLILINGRPIPDTPNDASATSIQGDLNGVPMSSIERIEVLPSSASGIYGGGAVGGVINVILKSNRSASIETRLNYDNTFDSDAARRKAEFSASFPLEGGKTEILVAGSFSDANRLLLQDRYDAIRPGYDRVYTNSPFYSLGVPPLGATANIYTTTATGLTLKEGGVSLGGARNTHLPSGYRGYAIDGAAPLIANAGSFNTNFAPTSQDDFGMRAQIGGVPVRKAGSIDIRRQMSPRLEVFMGARYTSSRTSDLSTRMFETSVPATSPTNPFNQTVTIYAPVDFDTPSYSLLQTRQVTGGFNFKFGQGWQLQADHSWSDSRVHYSSINLDTTWRTAAIADGSLNLFVDTLLYPIDFSDNLQYRDGHSGSRLLNTAVRVYGPVMKAPGGDVTMAASVIRQARYSPDLHLLNIHPNRPEGDTDRVNPGRSHETLSGYVEATIPLFGKRNARRGLQLLDVQLAARHERYEVNTRNTVTGAATYTLTPANPNPPELLANSTEYSSTNPTIGFRYKPVQDLMLRISWATAFRPPSYSQLQEPIRSTGQSNVLDPLNPGPAVRVYTLSGGNPDLEPESAKNWTAGVVLTPRYIPRLRVAVDYTRIQKVNNVASLTLQTIVDREAEFPGRVVRDPPGPGQTVGPIVEVYTNPMNLLGSLTEALDTSVSYNFSTPRLGNFNASFVATKLMRALQRQNETTSLDYVGARTGIGGLEYRGNANLNWNRERWMAGWNMTYYGTYKVNGPPWSSQTAWLLAMGDNPWIPSQTYHNVFVGYTVPSTAGLAGRLEWMNGTQLQAGIRNLFDKVPAFDASTAMSGMYVGTFGDLRLRSYWLSLKKSF